MEEGVRGLLAGWMRRVEGRVKIEQWNCFHLGPTFKVSFFSTPTSAFIILHRSYLSQVRECASVCLNSQKLTDEKPIYNQC